MSRRSAVGFDRRIDLEWLDAAAGKVAAGAGPREVRAYLHELLDGVVAGDKRGSARWKTVSVLSHVWSQVPDEATGLRDRAASLLQEVGPAERLALHWAMVLGTYPFAVDVADAVGRLVSLQGSVALSQLTRRLVEAWGERSTMVRATQRVVRSMVQWGVLKDTADKGVYVQASAAPVVSGRVAEVLVEAVLLDSEQDVMQVDQLVGHPALFPFQVQIGVHELRSAKRFRVHRHGLDVDVVGLTGAERSSSGLAKGVLW